MLISKYTLYDCPDSYCVIDNIKIECDNNNKCEFYRVYSNNLSVKCGGINYIFGSDYYDAEVHLAFDFEGGRLCLNLFDD